MTTIDLGRPVQGDVVDLILDDHRRFEDLLLAVVRHPAYVGSWLIGLGTVVMHFSPGGWFYECLGTDTIASKAFMALWSVWMLSVPVLLSKRAKVEDEALKEVFGEEWEAYARKTRYRLIPFVY